MLLRPKKEPENPTTHYYGSLNYLIFVLHIVLNNIRLIVVITLKVPERRKKGELRTQRSTTSAYDVFLGGSCNPTTWRQDIAIPHFKSQEITFYNPQQANWVPEMIELEHQV